MSLMMITPSYTIHVSQALVKTVKFITTFVSLMGPIIIVHVHVHIIYTVHVSLKGAIHSYCTGTCSWIIWTHMYMYFFIQCTVYFNYYMYMYIQLLGVCVLI